MTWARVSTRHPERLAPPPVLLNVTRALAVLDAVFWQDWEWRRYSFDRERDGTCLAHMGNGRGDLWYLLFLPSGAAVLRGFYRESAMNPCRWIGGSPWPGLFEGMPRSLHLWRNATDIQPGDITFVLWHPVCGRWTRGSVVLPPGTDPDGSERLLGQLDGDPASYVRLVQRRLKRSVNLDAVRAVYDGGLDADTILTLNPQADVRSVLTSARKMGYPMRKLTARRKAPAKGPPTTTPTICPPSAVKRRALGASSFTVTVRENKVELHMRDDLIASCDEGEAELYGDLFRHVRAHIEKRQ